MSRFLAVFALLVLGPVVTLATPEAAAAQPYPCEFCGDLSCPAEDHIYWSQVWFPGAEEVSYLGASGCFRYEPGCGNLIGCQEHEEEQLLLAEVRQLSTLHDLDALSAAVNRTPHQFALIPHRAILVVLKPDCTTRPVMGLVALDPSWIPEMEGRVAGWIPEAPVATSALRTDL